MNIKPPTFILPFIAIIFSSKNVSYHLSNFNTLDLNEMLRIDNNTRQALKLGKKILYQNVLDRAEKPQFVLSKRTMHFSISNSIY